MTDYTELSNGYIRRERDGMVIPKNTENLEYQEFLHALSAGAILQPYAPPVIDPTAQAKAELAATDSEIARVAEDLIQTLISKGVIAESDIPESARDKMARRAKLRARLA